MADKAQIAFRDHDGTRQQTSIDVIDGLTDISMTAIHSALKTWSIGGNDGEYILREKAAPTGVSAVSPVAQGSTQLILEMKDAVTGRVYKERLPMPDLLMADDPGPPVVKAWTVTGQGADRLTVANTNHSQWAALTGALDNKWQSPEGNTGTLERAYVER